MTNDYTISQPKLSAKDGVVTLGYDVTLAEPIEGQSSFHADIHIPVEMLEDQAEPIDILPMVHERVILDISDMRENGI